jgi:hypothetical protein
VPVGPRGRWTTELGEAPVEVISTNNGRVRIDAARRTGTAADRAAVRLDAARRAGAVNHFAFDRRSLAEVFLSLVGRPPTTITEEHADARRVNDPPRCRQA